MSKVFKFLIDFDPDFEVLSSSKPKESITSCDISRLSGTVLTLASFSIILRQESSLGET